MNILWITDPHLDFLPKKIGPKTFGQSMSEYESDAVLFTGDISESPGFLDNLKYFQEGYGNHVYFIMGNHDYYGSSFNSHDEKVSALDKNVFTWLRNKNALFKDFALVGNSGWYDIKYGNPNSQLNMSDFYAIADLRSAQLVDYHEGLIEACRERASEMAQLLRKDIDKACETHDNIFIATHVPPYANATWHQGMLSDDTWMPFFSSKATGDVIDEMLDIYPSKTFTVLCGHTHSSGRYTRRDNCVVYTGHSEYRDPRACGLIANGKLKTIGF